MHAGGQVIRPAVVRRYAVGTARETTDLLRSTIDGSDGPIRAELFSATARKVAKRIRKAAKNGRPVAIHSDSEVANGAGLRASLVADARIALSTHGDNPTKLHTKIMSTPSVAWFGTAAPSQSSFRRAQLDFAFVIDGAAARAMHAATTAAAAGDSAAIRSTARAALDHGIVINDPAHGVSYIDDAVESLVASARRRIIIGSKLINDERVLAQVAAAHDRGVEVLVATSPRNSIGDARRSVAALGDHVPLVIAAEHQIRLHGNALLVDDLALVGTATITRRGLARDTAGRSSREAAMLVNDPQIISDIEDGLAMAVGPDLVRFLRSSAGSA